MSFEGIREEVTSAAYYPKTEVCPQCNKLVFAASDGETYGGDFWRIADIGAFSFSIRWRIRYD